MDSIQKYDIFYTKEAITDIEEKADYIAFYLHASDVAEKWYLRLRELIQENLSTFPLKYSLYNVSPWNNRGVRQLIVRNDLVLYSVDTESHIVYIRAVCTRGQDLSAHLESI